MTNTMDILTHPNMRTLSEAKRFLLVKKAIFF